METTNVFSKNLDAYMAGSGLIIDQGGTSSSKTYSVLQLLYLIAKHSKRKLIISVVSYALPHLKLGAMRDFENILEDEGIIVDDIKNKTDLYYKIGNSIIEFFSADNLSKVHGPRRDILYLNECNHLKYEIYTQLRIRTKKCSFLDFNPTREFWVHDEVIPHEKHTFIKSTYLDNDLLDKAIIEQIESRRHNENWWRVYGLGETGRLEGVILPNWEYGDFDTSLPHVYGLDFGVVDPDALLRIAADRRNKRLYWKEELYQNGLSTSKLAQAIRARDVGRHLIAADNSAKRTIDDMRDEHKFNIKGFKKNPIVTDIKTLHDWQIIVDPTSYNLAKELNNWLWLDKKGEVPLDDFNHAIDAGRYGSNRVIKPISRIGPRGSKRA